MNQIDRGGVPGAIPPLPVFSALDRVNTGAYSKRGRLQSREARARQTLQFSRRERCLSIRIDTSSDLHWILVTVDECDCSAPTVAVERQALNVAAEGESRPPDQLLDIIARRALTRIPTANGSDGHRLITVHNLSVVWPK